MRTCSVHRNELTPHADDAPSSNLQFFPTLFVCPLPLPLPTECHTKVTKQAEKGRADE